MTKRKISERNTVRSKGVPLFGGKLYTEEGE
jgi:hypothetical protein